jgi:hypothetical protein
VKVCLLLKAGIGNPRVRGGEPDRARVVPGTRAAAKKPTESGEVGRVLAYRRHVSNIYQKLGAHSRHQAEAIAIGLGIFSQPGQRST